MTHQGGCLCGAVRFTIDAEPITTRACWCRLCQHISGGNATVNAVFPSDAASITGEVRWHASIADSGTPMQRGFCPNCGAPLFSKAETRPHLLVVRAGALDDPGRVSPAITIWTSQAPEWALIDPDLPQVERQAPPAG